MRNIIYIFIIVFFIVIYLRYFEYKALYFPMKEIEITPAEAGLIYDDIDFVTEDGIRLNAWFIPADNARFTLLFCHGNGGNISHRIEKIKVLRELGVSVFIFDYRGYGRSGGRPSEKGFYKDARASYKYLIFEKNVPQGQIILYGESLGGAVALDLACKRKVRAVITESTFSSTKDMARRLYPFFPTFLIRAKFDSLRKIKCVNVPKLIIHSQNDEIVPFGQSVSLFEAAREPKQHLVLMGNHNSCYMDSKDVYISGVRKFLSSLSTV